MCASVGFVYNVVDNLTLLSLLTVTSKKFADVWLASTVNFIDVWNLFRAEVKESNSSLECGHTMKIVNISPP